MFLPQTMSLWISAVADATTRLSLRKLVKISGVVGLVEAALWLIASVTDFSVLIFHHYSDHYQ